MEIIALLCPQIAVWKFWIFLPVGSIHKAGKLSKHFLLLKCVNQLQTVDACLHFLASKCQPTGSISVSQNAVLCRRRRTALSGSERRSSSSSTSSTTRAGRRTWRRRSVATTTANQNPRPASSHVSKFGSVIRMFDYRVCTGLMLISRLRVNR